MSVRRLAEKQPPSFAFTPENLEWVKAKVAQYPEGRQQSAVIPGAEDRQLRATVQCLIGSHDVASPQCL